MAETRRVRVLQEATQRPELALAGQPQRRPPPPAAVSLSPSSSLWLSGEHHPPCGCGCERPDLLSSSHTSLAASHRPVHVLLPMSHSLPATLAGRGAPSRPARPLTQALASRRLCLSNSLVVHQLKAEDEALAVHMCRLYIFGILGIRPPLLKPCLRERGPPAS